MGEWGTEKEKEEKRERELCHWHQKGHVWGNFKKRVLPWGIFLYRSPSSFEPVSTAVGMAPGGGGGCAAEVAAGTRCGMVAGRVRMGGGTY